MMKGGNTVLARPLKAQPLQAVKRKQFEKHHAASVEEQATNERTYTIRPQALEDCEPVTGLVPILRGAVSTRSLCLQLTPGCERDDHRVPREQATADTDAREAVE